MAELGIRLVLETPVNVDTVPDIHPCEANELRLHIPHDLSRLQRLLEIGIGITSLDRTPRNAQYLDRHYLSSQSAGILRNKGILVSPDWTVNASHCQTSIESPSWLTPACGR